MRVALVSVHALLVGACALPGGDVLTEAAPLVWSDCATALGRARQGEACAGFGSCVSDAGSCCVDSARCSSGVITVATRDCSACASCTDDAQCPEKEWCDGNHCQACPSNLSCPACPPPFVPLTRKGCATCECGPPSACEGCADADCRPSQYCQLECPGASCCVRQCAPAACEASPEGCQTSCSSQQSCAFCVATKCVCTGSSWRCEPSCMPEGERWAVRCKAP